MMRRVYIYNAKDAIEAQRLSDILKAADIPTILVDTAAGGTVKLIQGFSVYGTEIYVREDDADRAVQILRDELGEEFQEDEAEQETVKQPWYRNPRVIARIILVVALIGLLAGFIMQIK